MNKKARRLRRKIETTINTLYVLAIIAIILLLGIIILMFQLSSKEEIRIIHVEQVSFENPMKPKQEIVITLQKLNNEEKTEYCSKETKGIEEQVQIEPKDIELLAQIMYSEEEEFINKQNDEYVFKLAGSVIINRKEIKYRGAKTLEDVVYSFGQYAETTKDKIGRKDIPEIVYKWAEELLEDGPIYPGKLIYQSEFEQGSETLAHIGNQYFCLK